MTSMLWRDGMAYFGKNVSGNTLQVYIIYPTSQKNTIHILDHENLGYPKSNSDRFVLTKRAYKQGQMLNKRFTAVKL